MTYDIATRVSNAQSLVGLPVAASTGSIKIINLLGTPLSLAGRDVGAGADLAFRVSTTQAFDAGVTSLSVSVVVSANEDLSGPTVIGTSVILASGLGVGNESDVRIPSLSENQAAGALYMGLLYVPNTTPTSGAVSAWIPLGHSPNRQRRLAGNYSGPS